MSVYLLFNQLLLFIISVSVFSKEINELNSNNVVSILNSNENFLVFFYTENCSKCNIMFELFVELSIETEKSNSPVNFYKLNVNESPDVAIKFSYIDAPNIMLILGKYKLFYNYNGDSDLKEMIYFINK